MPKDGEYQQLRPLDTSELLSLDNSGTVIVIEAK